MVWLCVTVYTKEYCHLSVSVSGLSILLSLHLSFTRPSSLPPISSSLDHFLTFHTQQSSPLHHETVSTTWLNRCIYSFYFAVASFPLFSSLLFFFPLFSSFLFFSLLFFSFFSPLLFSLLFYSILFFLFSSFYSIQFFSFPFYFILFKSAYSTYSALPSLDPG